jgi:hypothetical protein
MTEAILRPGRTASLTQPAFAIELGEILDRSDWRNFFGFAPVEQQTERQLRRALIGIRKRQQTVDDAARSLQRQRAEVHMLKGAIASAKARRTKDQRVAGQCDGRALREFQRTLQTETHRRDAEAKECEAFQFLRLGQRDLAETAYEELEDFARDVEDARKRDLLIARAKRYRAQILQANAAGGAMGALNLMRGTDDTALELRQNHAPFLKWDAIEQAEIHYVTAYIAHRLNARLIAAQQLALAESHYRDVIAKLPKRLVFIRSATRRLRAEGQAGADRVTCAKTGSYDTVWLRM